VEPWPWEPGERLETRQQSIDGYAIRGCLRWPFGARFGLVGGIVLDGWMRWKPQHNTTTGEDSGLDWRRLALFVDIIRDHGHAHGSRRSELTNYLGEKPWWDPWNSTGKPLLLVDPNWTLIGQLPSSMHHPLGCCTLSMDGLSVEQEY